MGALCASSPVNKSGPVSLAAVIESARMQGRTVLTEVESKQVLEEAGVPVARSECARSAEEAVQLAERIGFPVVLKLLSPDVTHKSDVGVVRVGPESRAEAESAFDEIVSTVKQRQ